LERYHPELATIITAGLTFLSTFGKQSLRSLKLLLKVIVPIGDIRCQT